MSVNITLLFDNDREVEVEAVATSFYKAEPDCGVPFGGVEDFILHWPHGGEWAEDDYGRLSNEQERQIIDALEDSYELEPDVD